MPLTSEPVYRVVDIFNNQAHSAPVALIRSEDGKKAMIPAADGMYVGQMLTGAAKSGNTLPLSQIPEGTNIYNIELHPGDGGKLVRGSGSFARIVAKEGKVAVVRLPSGSSKKFSLSCRAVVGTVAGAGRLDKPLVKAGNAFFKYKARNKLWPRSAAIHMNAVDHPFGGGRHPHTGKPQTTSANAPPGRKVGSIKARRMGKK